MNSNITKELKILYEAVSTDETIKFKDDNIKLLYYCAKIEKILQDIIDTDAHDSEAIIEYNYYQLLQYCIKILKNEKIDIDTLNMDRAAEIYDDDIYILMVYAVNKLEYPNRYIYDKSFKQTIKSIIFQIMTSSLFNSIKNKTYGIKQSI